VPARRRISKRPRLFRLRRLAIAGAAGALGLWALLLVTGYETIWARGHEAFTLSGGTLTYYRSGWDYVYFLQAGAGGPLSGSERGVIPGLRGRVLWRLTFGQSGTITQWPAYYADGLALNAVESVPLQDAWFESGGGLWRHHIRLWWIAVAAAAPWCVGSALLRCKLAITRMRLARRHRPGRCRRCGYCTEGLAAGAPCPECGMGRAAAQGTNAKG